MYALIAFGYLAIRTWISWYRSIVTVTFLAVSIRHRLPLIFLPLVCMLLLIVVLHRLAADDVRGDPFYFAFYVIVGAGWLGGITLLFPFLGISPRDDALERGNQAALYAVTGALLGATFAFVGGNVGNGPGLHVVLFSALLSTALLVSAWLLMDYLVSVAESITVDRNVGAGIRFGGLLMAVGIIGGWAVAGDWVSAAATVRDFLFSAWPAACLALASVLVERTLKHRTGGINDAGSAAVALVYVVSAFAWVGQRGFVP